VDEDALREKLARSQAARTQWPQLKNS
jgi:hypothetical protein